MGWRDRYEGVEFLPPAVDEDGMEVEESEGQALAYMEFMERVGEKVPVRTTP